MSRCILILPLFLWCGACGRTESPSESNPSASSVQPSDSNATDTANQDTVEASLSSESPPLRIAFVDRIVAPKTGTSAPRTIQIPLGSSVQSAQEVILLITYRDESPEGFLILRGSDDGTLKPRIVRHRNLVMSGDEPLPMGVFMIGLPGTEIAKIDALQLEFVPLETIVDFESFIETKRSDGLLHQRPLYVPVESAVGEEWLMAGDFDFSTIPADELLFFFDRSVDGNAEIRLVDTDGSIESRATRMIDGESMGWRLVTADLKGKQIGFRIVPNTKTVD